MSKSRKTAASVTAPVTEAPVTAPEVIPVAVVAAPETAPETKTKTKVSRTDLRAMGVGAVYTDEETARANKPSYTPAEGSSYDLYVVTNGETYYTWSIDSRRAYEHVARHLGFTATKVDKVVRQSAVTALKDENAILKAKIAEFEAKMAAANGQTH
jgi:hypothetical protein